MPQSQQIATSNKRVYRRPVFFGDDYQADASESVTKIGGIRTFVVGPSLVAHTDSLRYSGGVISPNADWNKSSLAQYTPHPQYSAGKDIGQVTNSLHLSFSKIIVKDNYLIWAEHYLGSSKSVIYMQEINGSISGTNITSITNSFDDVVRDSYNYRTNQEQRSSDLATNGFGFDIQYEDGCWLQIVYLR